MSQESGDVWISQQQREAHMWILGSTGEGKSKFVEYLIRKDIDRLKAEEDLSRNDRRSCSLCFIDPTPQGKIAYKVLNYCAQIGFKKVLLVDPYQIKARGKICPINPFILDQSHIEESVDYLEDAFRVLFEVEDLSRTANIATYLHAVFTLLHHAQLTPYDLIWFTSAKDIESQVKRKQIYGMVRDRIESGKIHKMHHRILEKHIDEVEFAFSNYPVWRQEISSTVRRLNQLINNSSMRLIFGHRKGINFEKLIADGWVILVNASTGEGLGQLQARLLATVIINQIIFTIERLRRHGFDKPYYIYLDEAQRYATDKLVEVLDTKRNIDLRLVLSNHFPKQFKERLRGSVKGNTKTKIAFYVENHDERLDVANELYGGKLNIKEVEYALRQQRKRQAVMKIGKQGSIIAKTHDLPDAAPNSKFIDGLLSTNNYATVDEVLADYEARYTILQRVDDTIYATTRRSDKPSKKASKTAHRPNSKVTAPRPAADSAEWEDSFQVLREDEITYPTDDSK
jgi:hypothetical protein